MPNVIPIAVSNMPLPLVQQRFSLIDLSADIRIVDNLQVADVMVGTKSEVNFYAKSDGQLLIERYLETLPFSTKPKELIKQFLVSPNTHVYDAVAFSPLKTPPTTLNYWTGPTVLPVVGDWSAISNFLLEITCNNDKTLCQYFIKYLAHMLQKPEEKPGIAIVMLSKEGAGKGTTFALLNAIWGRSTLEVADIGQVIGTFNAALERNYVICMDEALFKGDKASMERLKSLITEPNIRVEQKYQPSRTIDSYHRFFAASNSEHFATVSLGERRLLFLRVSDKRIQDLPYFESIYRAISNKTVISAMVHDLVNLDLSKFNVRQRPATKEHLNQKIQSLSGFERFWFEVLSNGGFSTRSEVGYASTSFNQWSDARFITTNELMNAYQYYDKNTSKYAPVQSRDIASTLSKICPGAYSDRMKIFIKQERGYQLPKLVDARKEFEVLLASKVTWPQYQSEDVDSDEFKTDEYRAESDLEYMYE
jgi:hypothetical protein